MDMDEKITTDTQKIDLDEVLADQNISSSGDPLNSSSMERIGAEMSGLMKDRWTEFIAKVKDGDEVIPFSSGPSTWAKKVGRRGYAIRRNGTIVAEFVTMRN